METNDKETEVMEKSILRIKRKFQEGIPADKVIVFYFNFAVYALSSALKLSGLWCASFLLYGQVGCVCFVYFHNPTEHIINWYKNEHY